MSNQRYNLLQTAIVAAINAGVQSERNTVWEPTEKNDVLEADALVRMGYAELTDKPVTTNTHAERQLAKRKEQGDPPISGASIDAIKQADGTFRDSFGRQVNEDGTLYNPNQGATDGDPVLAEVLKGTVPDVEDELESGEYTAEQLDQLEAMEKAGQGRKGVMDAIQAARDAE